MFNLSEKTSEYIRRQRTNLKSTKDADVLGAEYYDECNIEATELAANIKQPIKSILSIGCGVGGVDVLLQEYLSVPHYFLFDGDGVTSNVGYTNKHKQVFGNSTANTEKFIEDNSKEPQVFNFIEDIGHAEYDVVISLLSMGFHYPVDMYKDEIDKSLKVGGLLILDMRKKAEVPDNFKFIKVLKEAGKKGERRIYRRFKK